MMKRLLNVSRRFSSSHIYFYRPSLRRSLTTIHNNVTFSSKHKRSHYCGELSSKNVGQHVVLCGWIEHFRKIRPDLYFIVLRDRSGNVQLKIETTEVPKDLRPECVISLRGKIASRPKEMINPNMKSGEIEVEVDEMSILSTAEVLPLQLANAEEDIRLQYRYLDLRREVLQQNLKIRSDALHIIRSFFHDEKFYEIETPTLFKSTPEGAREFLVPTRQKGKFYALTQSPQQYKQLLMIGGLDKYFQIARCYRDELGRSDRQPEFTQIDLEMSFITEEDIYSLIERLLAKVWKDILNLEIKIPFMRMSYRDAMNRYGTDKPDTRFGMELKELTSIFSNTKIKMFENIIKNNGYIYGINAQQLAKLPNKEIKNLEKEAIQMGAKGLAILKVTNEGLTGGPSKHFSEEEKNQIIQTFNAQPNDLILLIADADWETTVTALGKVRLACGKHASDMKLIEIPPNLFNFLWIIDFPLFHKSEFGQGGFGKLESMHHPFTSPHPEDAELLYSDPIKVRGLHYDCVVNGVELGGGSIRIHDSKMQEYIFTKILEIPKEETNERFGHLLEALKYGAPPHGGIALGFDRLVALLCMERAKTLRDVIAFPKSANGNELMTDSPGSVLDDQLKEIHLKIIN